jgi:hypothetical protein
MIIRAANDVRPVVDHCKSNGVAKTYHKAKRSSTPPYLRKFAQGCAARQQSVERRCMAGCTAVVRADTEMSLLSRGVKPMFPCRLQREAFKILNTDHLCGMFDMLG